jgi:hypothetical protein
MHEQTAHTNEQTNHVLQLQKSSHEHLELVLLPSYSCPTDLSGADQTSSVSMRCKGAAFAQRSYSDLV